MHDDPRGAWRSGREHLGEGAQELHRLVREQPWSALAAAALAGLIIGLLSRSA